MTTTPPGRPAGRYDVLLVACLGAALFLPALGIRDLWTSPEARVAQVAREMRRSGDWLVPTLGGELRIKKPPLAYWLCAAASLPWDDVTTTNSRIPNALAAIGTMLLVFAMGRRLFGRTAAWIAAVAAGTTWMVWWEGRHTGIESPLLFLNTLALYCWWRYRESLSAESDAPDVPRVETSGRPRPAPWLLAAYAVLGLSFLQKGPVGPALVLCVAWAYLFAAGQWKAPRSRWTWHAAGLAVFLVFSLWWYGALLFVQPGAWDIWMEESVGRLAGLDHIKEWSYYLRKVPGDGQPWFAVAILAPFLLRGASGARRRRLLFPIAWAAAALVFFSLFGSKKNYYILPIYPTLSLMAGALIAGLIEGEAPPRLRAVFRWLLYGVGGLLLVAAAAAYPVCLDRLERGKLKAVYMEQPQFALMLAVAAVAGAGLLYAARRRRFGMAAGVIAAGAICGFALYLSLMPGFNRLKSERLVCDYLRPRLGADDRVRLYYMFGPELFIFYLDHPVERLGGPPPLADALDADEPGRLFVLIDVENLESLKRHEPEIYGRLKRLAFPVAPKGWVWVEGVRKAPSPPPSG